MSRLPCNLAAAALLLVHSNSCPSRGSNRPLTPPAAARPAPPLLPRAGLGRGGGAEAAPEEREEEMEDADGEGQQGQELSFGVGYVPERAGGMGGGAASRALQLSLPAQLGMEPEDLQRIRDGLYAGSQTARQPPTKQRRILTIGAPPQAAAEAGGAAAAGTAAQAAAATAPASAVAAAAAAAAGASRPALAARNAWRKQPAAPLQPPVAAGRSATAPRTPPPGGLPPLLPAGPTPVAASGKQCLVPAPPASRPSEQEQGAERCLPDAGLYGGAAFRAGWAPNAVLAHTGGRASSAAHLVVRQLSVGARVAPAGEPAGTDSAFQQRQRDALEAALRLHLEHSSPDATPENGLAAAAEAAADGDADGAAAAAAAAAGVPQWRLRCQRRGELRQLTLHYIELCNAAAAEVGGQRERMREVGWRCVLVGCALNGWQKTRWSGSQSVVMTQAWRTLFQEA